MNKKVGLQLFEKFYMCLLYYQILIFKVGYGKVVRTISSTEQNLIGEKLRKNEASVEF